MTRKRTCFILSMVVLTLLVVNSVTATVSITSVAERGWKDGDVFTWK